MSNVGITYMLQNVRIADLIQRQGIGTIAPTGKLMGWLVGANGRRDWKMGAGSRK